MENINKPNLNQGNRAEQSKDDSEERVPAAARNARDVNSKEIFRNKRLASQFLRDYSDLWLFEHVRPEDIEDVSERYRLLLGIEVEGDSFMKVRVQIKNQIEEVYVISLIEHKSSVDYDVTEGPRETSSIERC